MMNGPFKSIVAQEGGEKGGGGELSPNMPPSNV